MLKLTLENLNTRQQAEFKEKNKDLKVNESRKDEIFVAYNGMLR